MNRYLQIARKNISACELCELTPPSATENGRKAGKSGVNSQAEEKKNALPQEPLVLRVTGTQKEMAGIVAKQRVSANDATRKAHQDAGAEGNYSRDYYGALAEIAVRQWLEEAQILDSAALVSDRPDKRPDL